MATGYKPKKQKSNRNTPQLSRMLFSCARETNTAALRAYHTVREKNLTPSAHRNGSTENDGLSLRAGYIFRFNINNYPPHRNPRTSRLDRPESATSIHNAAQRRRRRRRKKTTGFSLPSTLLFPLRTSLRDKEAAQKFPGKCGTVGKRG